MLCRDQLHVIVRLLSLLLEVAFINVVYNLFCDDAFSFFYLQLRMIEFFIFLEFVDLEMRALLFLIVDNEEQERRNVIFKKTDESDFLIEADKRAE